MLQLIIRPDLLRWLTEALITTLQLKAKHLWESCFLDSCLKCFMQLMFLHVKIHCRVMLVLMMRAAGWTVEPHQTKIFIFATYSFSVNAQWWFVLSLKMPLDGDNTFFRIRAHPVARRTLYSSRLLHFTLLNIWHLFIGWVPSGFVFALFF